MPPFGGDDAGAVEPPDDEVLAGELVLGVLSGETRREAEARRERDGAFAALAGAWERRLAPWLAAVPAEPVPEELWERITERLGWRSRTPSGSLWQSLALWRAVAAAGLLAAIALWATRPEPAPAPVVASLPSAPEPAAKPVTTLAHADGTPGWLASVDRTRGTVLMVPVPAPADPQGRVPELWIIPAGQAPRSLGAVSINKAHTVEVPAASRAVLTEPGSVLAITLEPSAGIPHPGPSGPVIARGTITI